MIEEQNTGEYVAPEINVYDIKSQEVLCTSGAGNDSYGNGDSSGWY